MGTDLFLCREGAGPIWGLTPALTFITSVSYALFVVRPESENFNHLLVLQHLVNQAMLNIDTA